MSGGILRGQRRGAVASVRGPLGPFGRTTPSKRQVARMNLGYLRSTSASSKKTVQAWVDAVNERARGR